MDLNDHEEFECKGINNCTKCGLTISKKEKDDKSHSCFTAMIKYLSEMLDSKNIVIQTLK